MIKVYIDTYGCSANQNDSEIMAGLLEKADFILVDTVENADVIIVNTCIVKEPTHNKMNHLVRKYKSEFPNKKIIVAGCMPQVLKLPAEVSAIGPHNIEDIVEVVNLTVKGKFVNYTNKESAIKVSLPKLNKNKVIDIIQILEGCNGNCSYCIVKHVKPTLFFFPKHEIVNEVKNAVDKGCKEIWITSQDNGAYGLENNDISQLPSLLRKIVSIPGEFFVRVGMMNPNNILPMLDELIEVFKSDKLFKFIHIPVQSGNNDILTKMNRKYSVNEFMKIVNEFRKTIPKITISTDVICGFPSETYEQFEDTLDLINEIKPDHLNISRFGARPGTAAQNMNDHVDKILVKERSNLITKLFWDIALENNKKWIDWQGEIIIDEIGKKGTVIGRNFAYKQVVVEGDESMMGKLIKIKIEEVTPFYLIGKRID